MTRLRVAHVTLGLAVGGQEKLLLEFARHADRARFDPLVIALGHRGTLADGLEALDCPVHSLDTPTGLRPGLVPRLARLFRQLGVDVVHTHDDRPLLYGLPAAWWAGVRRRVHTHHHGRIPQISRRQSLVIALASRLARPFVCVSHDSARHMIAHGVPASRVTVLHNGIDLARFPYRGPQPDGPAVCVARLSPEKDVQNLVRALPHVVAALPDFRLEIAGDGPCREELVGLIDALRVRDHVRLLGEVRDVPALLARARLFVLPSQSEGVSLTILEAMARGLPVVATHVGGNPEVVLDGATGRLVPSRDPAALARAVIEVARDPNRARQMGHAGRQRVEAQFDVRQMVARYEALYEGRPLPEDEPSGRMVHVNGQTSQAML